jgi:hypothetical protein
MMNMLSSSEVDHEVGGSLDKYVFEWSDMSTIKIQLVGLVQNRYFHHHIKKVTCSHHDLAEMLFT